MSGQLCLRWNNHSTAFNNLLNKIYLEDVYSDSTIMCHGRFFPVHRFVLSTCSEYFEEMFRQCIRLHNKHPFIIVKDVHPEQMEALLNYMYKGEVNVPQEMLPELIKAAEAFKIKGLAVSDDESTSKSRKRSHVSSPPSVSKKSRRHEEKCSNSDIGVSNDSKTAQNRNSCDNSSSLVFPSSSTATDEAPTIPMVIKDEPTDDTLEPIAIIDDSDDGALSVKQEDSNYDTYDESKGIAESFDFDATGETFDKDQESTSWDSSQVFDAVGNEDDPTNRLIGRATAELHHLRYDHSDSGKSKVIFCTLGNCTFKSTKPVDVKRHMLTHTGEKPFKCQQCSYRTSRKFCMDRHTRTVHCDDNPLI